MLSALQAVFRQHCAVAHCFFFCFLFGGVTARRSHPIGWTAGRKCVWCPSCAENKTRQAATGECSKRRGVFSLALNSIRIDPRTPCPWGGRCVNRLFCCQQWTQRCVAVLALSSRVSCCYVRQAEPSVRILQPAWAVVVLHWCCTATQSLFFTANKTWCQSFFFSFKPMMTCKCSAFYTAAIKHGAIPVMMSPPRIYAARLKGGENQPGDVL